jgi:predicted Zn-dependent protease
MRMAPRSPTVRLLTALVCASLSFAAGAQEDPTRLPDLGSSANALVSPQEAQDYGAAMLRQMRGLDMVVDDAMLDDYINDLGHRLAANSAKPKDHFSFFIVKDPVINAFAAPGGYIAVNSGLIVITRNESELAGVISHEIGHITQNHLERAFEASKKDAPLLALVLLGAIAAGAGGGASAGDAGMAVLAGGQGLMMQRQINFTRKDEVEADRAGIQTLANAGYDPNAMAAFFERMQDTMRVGSGGDRDVPELLQTHPVTLSRISDAKSRAGTLIAQQKLRPTHTTLVKDQWEKSTAPIIYVKDPTALLKNGSKSELDDYMLMRERVRVLSSDALPLSTYYGDNLARDKSFDTPSNRYGYALALTRSGRASQAIEQLQNLLKTYPGNQILQVGLADAYLQAGQRGASLSLYAELSRLSPRNRTIALGYAQALVAGNGDDAGKAADMLRPMLDDTDEPTVYRTYARASEKAGDPVRAGEAYADASYLSGRPFDAMEQLKRLLKRPDLDYYARARIQARISELTPLVMELRKRRVQTEDNPSGRDQQ